MHESENEVAQLCPTLSDPMDCSLPGSSVHGILQARVLEWGAIAFSDVESKKIQMNLFTIANIFRLLLLLLLSRFSRVRLCVTP